MSVHVCVYVYAFILVGVCVIGVDVGDNSLDIVYWWSSCQC